VALQGKLYRRKADVAKSEAAFTQLGTAPWPEVKLAAQNNLGQLKLSQDQVDAALQLFTKVAATKPENPAQTTQKLEGMLRQATSQIKQKQYQPAITVLEEVGKLADPKDNGIQALLFLRRGDAFRAQDKAKPALYAYLHVDTLFFQNPEYHAEALHHLAELWPEVGQAPRGQNAQARLKQSYPNSKWAKP